MKNIIALVLCLLMVVSLGACVGQVTPEESTANTKQTETTPATEKNQQPEESSEPTETEPTETQPVETEPVETEPAFDTSWAGDEYVMPIPEPPFAYQVDIKGTSVVIKSTNGGMDGDVTHQLILNYCEALKAAGFTVNLSENTIGERYGRTCYEFMANDEIGNYVNLIDDGGGVVIVVDLATTSD